MSNLINKTIRLNKFTFCLLFAMLILILSSCKKDDTLSDCNCQGTIAFTIQDSDEQIGFLFKNADNSNENIPPYNYGIHYAELNCGNCVHNFFICNDSFLLELGDIPSYPGIKVKFSGYAKNLCKGIISPADYTYNYIILTKINKQ